VRLTNSGTEAAMSAIRLARAATGRARIVKFDGCYHGHADALLARAGSGVATLGIPGSAGVTDGAARDTIVVAYNEVPDFDGGDVAAVIVEPVAANMGVVPPAPGFLEGLRAWCDRSGALLIFDEVITGFRLARAGAHEAFGVTPDVVCLGKVIGGGLPVGAYAARAELMDFVAPAGPMYQAGTLSGNPVAVAAGRAVLDAIEESPPYARLESVATRLCDAVVATGAPVTVNRAGSLFSVFFTRSPVENFDGARAQDADAFASFFHRLLGAGVHCAPSAFEAWFVSEAHTDEDVERTIEALRAALA
jgi:glutamate-1-semialdehyde 2,1-aminomutase